MNVLNGYIAPGYSIKIIACRARNLFGVRDSGAYLAWWVTHGYIVIAKKVPADLCMLAAVVAQRWDVYTVAAVSPCRDR